MNKEEELFTQAIILIDLRIIRSLAFVASSRINFDKKNLICMLSLWPNKNAITIHFSVSTNISHAWNWASIMGTSVVIYEVIILVMKVPEHCDDKPD